MLISPEEVSATVRDMVSGELADRLIASLQPSVRIVPEEADESLGPGQSHFGGWPDVPRGFTWPTCTGVSNPKWWGGFIVSQHGADSSQYDEITLENWRNLGKPMYSEPKALSLLAQINLSELPSGWDIGLPATGQLLFFCDTGDELVQGGPNEPLDRWRVVWIDLPLDELAEMARPGDDPDCRPPVRALQFKPEWTISDGLRLSEGELPPFELVRDALIGSWGDSHHRLLGHPQPIQGHLEYEAEMTLRQPRYDQSIPGQEIEKSQWRCLLQLDGEDGLDWIWGDLGRLHYMIRAEDLMKRQFDDVVVVLECH